jgi:large subunit ribosomal protein L30
MASEKTLKITQVRSTIGARWKQRESLRTLGLRKIRQTVVREDNAQTRGLIKTVHHLVEVAEVGDERSREERRTKA